MRSRLFLSLNCPSLHSGQFRDKKSLDLHEKSLDLSNYEIFPHKILKSRTFKKSSILIVKRQPFTHLLSACLLSCNRVAASRMQIVPAWLPVACKFWLILFMLHATAGHVGTICMQLGTTRYNLYASPMPILHVQAASFGSKPTVFCKHAPRTII